MFIGVNKHLVSLMRLCFDTIHSFKCCHRTHFYYLLLWDNNRLIWKLNKSYRHNLWFKENLFNKINYIENPNNFTIWIYNSLVCKQIVLNCYVVRWAEFFYILFYFWSIQLTLTTGSFIYNILSKLINRILNELLLSWTYYLFV